MGGVAIVNGPHNVIPRALAIMIGVAAAIALLAILVNSQR